MTDPAGPPVPSPHRPWRDGRHVDEAEALHLLRTRLPDLGASRVELLGVGWDNTAHLVDGTWLVRFPRRQAGADLTDRELLVLPRLAPLLPLAVPAPEHVGVPVGDAGFPWRFTVARVVPGVEWWRDPPAPDRALPAARHLAAALAVLHSADTLRSLDGAWQQLPVDPNRRSESLERLRRSAAAHDRLSAAGLLGPGLGLPALRALAERAAEAPPAPAVLVHGDLHVRHVLVEGGAPTGLVDFGDVCLAEPSVDLQVAFALFEGGAREAFLDRYGSVPPGVLDRARLLAATLHLVLADSARDVDDQPLLVAALEAAHRAVRG